MSYIFNNKADLENFIIKNRKELEALLLNEASIGYDKIEEIKLIGGINLVENAYHLILMFVNNEEQKVIDFAKKEGVAWAKTTLTLSFKLEWVKAIRKSFWSFLYEYEKTYDMKPLSENSYEMVIKINKLIDEFFQGFFISYSDYKEELLEKERKLVENLSVPIIPITNNTSILPLIGTIDTYRAGIIEEKVLMEIGKNHVEKLLMDLSGIAEMDKEAIHYFLKLLDGISMMGCETTITGLRPDIVREIIAFDVSFGEKVKTTGNLQQALGLFTNKDKEEKVLSSFKS
ncbi:STAS domain-containing protein [Oceanobacillus manasiensis]|uniref:STAS domain-containing protein n=1 Tax=Oceanobacillus manasiensis TaxID=586413 RepID=UPI0005AAEBE4|nr:STAS domain-containing protein [Oceanobacillus manasiensis]